MSRISLEFAVVGDRMIGRGVVEDADGFITQGKFDLPLRVGEQLRKVILAGYYQEMQSVFGGLVPSELALTYQESAARSAAVVRDPTFDPP